MIKPNYPALRKFLLEGGVLAYPTETVWGLAADTQSPKAIEQIFEIKKREPNKTVSLLVRDQIMAKQYVKVSPLVEGLMEVFWPGPLTLVLPALSQVPKHLCSLDGFIGLRNSSHEFVRYFMRDYPNAITSTSANLSGQPPAQSAADLDWLPLEVKRVDWPAAQSKSAGSTVVKIESEKIQCLRDGDLPMSWIETVEENWLTSLGESQLGRL